MIIKRSAPRHGRDLDQVATPEKHPQCRGGGTLSISQMAKADLLALAWRENVVAKKATLFCVKNRDSLSVADDSFGVVMAFADVLEAVAGPLVFQAEACGPAVCVDFGDDYHRHTIVVLVNVVEANQDDIAEIKRQIAMSSTFHLDGIVLSGPGMEQLFLDQLAVLEREGT